MTIWWESLTLLEQIFALIAFAASAVLILQTILLLFSVGGGHDHDFGHEHDLDHDHDFDHDHDLDHGDDHDFDNDHDYHHDHHDPGLRIFTVRGFVTFFCIFGWLGLVLLRENVSITISILTATVVGLIFMVLVAFCMAAFYRLQSNGNIPITAAIGTSGTVYIPVPPKRSGTGKITANVAGRFSEFDAVTDGDEALETGLAVTVVSVTGNNTLVVIKK